MTYKTEQENFWAGEFGDEYISRNQTEHYLASNLAFFSRIFSSTNESIATAIEFGANVGMKLQAIKRLLPEVQMSAVEINEQAVQRLNDIEGVSAHHSSILDFEIGTPCDFALIKGVLIHINPDELPVVYEKLYRSSQKYICIAEYYNPSPVEVSYRGHKERLFKRDFAGEMLDAYPDLNLVDYGFVYHRDQVFPQDDITWFLLQKQAS